MRNRINPFSRPVLALLPALLALSACESLGNMVDDAPAPELAGTQWVVVEIDGKKPLGTDLTAQFSNDGRVSGNSGCNQFSGVYIQTGAKVRFGELLSTRRACAEADRQQQETKVLDILEGETTIRSDRRELRVRGANGVLLMSPSN